MFFTCEKKHDCDREQWIVEGNSFESYEDAMHRFHAVFNAHGYGNNSSLDYVSVSVETQDGRVLTREIDDRIPPELYGEVTEG